MSWRTLISGLGGFKESFLFSMEQSQLIIPQVATGLELATSFALIHFLALIRGLSSCQAGRGTTISSRNTQNEAVMTGLGTFEESASMRECRIPTRCGGVI